MAEIKLISDSNPNRYFVLAWKGAVARTVTFFAWYNCYHMHSGLDYVTPQDMQDGKEKLIFAKRNALIELNREMHPTRHGGSRKIFGIPNEVRLKHKTKITEMK